MGDRDRLSDRDRDRDRERERRRDKEDRDRDRDRTRSTRSRTRSPDRTRSRHRRSRSRSPERSHRSHRRHRHQRTPSSSPSRKRHRPESEDDREREKQGAAALDFVDGIAREKLEKKESDKNDNGVGEGGSLMDEDEMEMMKKLGIPTGFDSTKGKPVPGADVSGIRAVTKRQPRQYMNRRGGFNRPLPLERNR
ncbi:hypothetical protein OIU84_000635 [Salix udensis]|uniref:U4/U6.U5 small nuclear ribonucleoprotein 27kDa protein domain-containing protein n=1 Tax=Salix udensis TaxID=889485 RepID=A0AAD6L6R5_9ROSI|nr:hypothetical protein OIU84_000635 [Salix udensis]